MTKRNGLQQDDGGRLRKLFPMIPERGEVQMKIQADKSLSGLFESWDAQYQEEFLDFCSGIGYMFPGERGACYSADLLLRQYKRLRGEKGKKFSYKDVKTVYTIIFFERSPQEFHDFGQNYIHKFEQKSDSGLELELLQKYCFIALDIFRKNLQNKDINSELEAWLVFLSEDEPEEIEKLIRQYPKFKTMYEDVYELCQNIGRVMQMFSKELQELDRNTVQYMIDVMQDEIDEQKCRIDELNRENTRLKQLLEQKNMK